MRKKDFYFVLLLFAVLIAAVIWQEKQDARLMVTGILFAALYVLFYSTEIAATYYLYMADRSLKKCDTPRAIDYYRKVHQVAPGYTAGKAALAVIKTVEGKWDEAGKLYREVLRQRPNDASLQYNFAITLINKGSYEEGIANLLLIIHFYPHLYYPHAALGEVYLHLGRYEEAYRHLSIALRINAMDPVARDNLELALKKINGECNSSSNK